jgi:hypothetical protein
MCHLIETTETALESLETIVQIEATNANRTILDRSYATVLEAQLELTNLLGKNIVQTD